MEQKKIKEYFSKFLVKKGQKEKSEKIYYNIIKKLKKDVHNKQPLNFLNQSLDTLLPKIKVKTIPQKFNNSLLFYTKPKEQYKNSIKILIGFQKKKNNSQTF